MSANLVTSFVASITSIFDRMLDCPLTRGKVQRMRKLLPYKGVSAIVDVEGESAKGRIVLNLSRSVALGATKAWLQEPVGEMGAEVIDFVGEMGNILVGQTRASLGDSQLAMSLPTVRKEAAQIVEFPGNMQPVRIPFHCVWGEVVVDIGIKSIAGPGEAVSPPATASPVDEAVA